MIIRRTGLGGGASSKTPGSDDGEPPSCTADTACRTAWALWVENNNNTKVHGMKKPNTTVFAGPLELQRSPSIPGSELNLFSVPCD